MLFITASDFTFTTRHIHTWALFPLWLSLFIPSGAISPLFSSSILGTYWHGKFIFQCHISIVLYSMGLYFHHQTHPQLNVISIWHNHFIFCRAVSNYPFLALPQWSSSTISFPLFILFMGSLGKKAGVNCHFIPQWTAFCQNSSLWPVYLEWPCTAWLIASSYISHFAPAKLWSMKRY